MLVVTLGEDPLASAIRKRGSASARMGKSVFIAKRNGFITKKLPDMARETFKTVASRPFNNHLNLTLIQPT